MEFEFTKLEDEEFAFRNMKDDEVLAEISWTMLGDVMAVEHTFVSPTLRGQGVAKKLLDRAADYAREHDYKMEPICSYVVTAFERYDEYKDIKA
ncbi:GNAT family N-acetyltransferase [Sporosarcina pasteurii]|uniref:Acetyltransferase (GNAT) family n=1 Tax=Sporosarcina pasteurii TaxID=1474 RepID=A0A380CJI6_SPOPA|nr:GNAT family N-acetyltransferase [Sporosarcina pasteurii]MDS9472154.1 GNAT family N-acetyltransferase [Sporosarcina pasteurii]QBQ06866.1 N-acetyltransferase [Sporosarcina pasteurii]SUJ20340.1 Acetyltransferase (GNAT) family [Sporosarcina pasteurii]